MKFKRGDLVYCTVIDVERSSKFQILTRRFCGNREDGFAVSGDETAVYPVLGGSVHLADKFNLYPTREEALKACENYASSIIFEIQEEIEALQKAVKEATENEANPDAEAMKNYYGVVYEGPLVVEEVHSGIKFN